MNKIIGMIVGAVVIAVVFFYGGMLYAGHQASGARAQFAGQFGGRGGAGGAGGRGGGAAGGFTIGSIVSMDATSITLALPGNGGSKVIFFSPSTAIEKPTTVDASQLSSGENVMVMGTANSDGSITAQSIQVRPAGFGGRGATSTPSSGGTNAPMQPAQ